MAISALPANAAPITGAIGNQSPSGSTPTLPALQGSINYAASYMKSTPGRSAAVVFVTDGLPMVAAARSPRPPAPPKQAFAGTPQVKTYVVGLGATQSLDEIALAGSGGATHFFPATGDVAAQLTAALKQIAGAITCDYVIQYNNRRPSFLKYIRYCSIRQGASIGIGHLQTLRLHRPIIMQHLLL